MPTYAKAGRYHELNFAGGVLAPGMSVTVRLPGTSTAAALWTSRDKTAAAANPVVVDTNGNLSFYADPGYYDLFANGVTLPNVLVPVDPELPAPEGTYAPVGGTVSAYKTVKEDGVTRTAREILEVGFGLDATDDEVGLATRLGVQENVFLRATHGERHVPKVIAASGAAVTLDLALGNVQDVTLTANCTFSFTGATSGLLCVMRVWLRQDSTGNRTATWPSSVLWDNGTTPTINATAGALTILEFATVDGGTTWMGRLKSKHTPSTLAAAWNNPAPITVDQALARTSQTAPVGTDTDGYALTAPGTDRNMDFRNFVSIGYFDWDTFQHGLQTHVHQGDAICGTPHGFENKPIRLGSGTTPIRLSIVGGKTLGDQPETLTWGEMKHGRAVQDNWDTGGTNSSSPTQDGDGITVYMKNGSWMYIDGLRSRSIMDGIQLFGDTATSTNYGICYVRNVWLERVRDTAFTSELGHVFRAFDCLIENAYGLIDVRGGPNVNTLENIWEYCIIGLKKLPGGFRKTRSQTSHDKIYKDDLNISPKQHFRKCWIALEDSTEDPNFRSDGTYTDVTIYWLGTGAYPWTIRTGQTVQNADGTGLAAAQAAWNAKVADWKTRHGVTSFDVVDMDKMIHPVAPPA